MRSSRRANPDPCRRPCAARTVASGASTDRSMREDDGPRTVRLEPELIEAPSGALELEVEHPVERPRREYAMDQVLGAVAAVERSTVVSAMLSSLMTDQHPLSDLLAMGCSSAGRPGTGAQETHRIHAGCR